MCSYEYVTPCGFKRTYIFIHSPPRICELFQNKHEELSRPGNRFRPKLGEEISNRGGEGTEPGQLARCNSYTSYVFFKKLLTNILSVSSNIFRRRSSGYDKKMISIRHCLKIVL